MNQDEQSGGEVVTRKIDELLRNPSSSLIDIISDDETISEFRSGNAKLISRLTSAEGVDMLISLITQDGELPEIQVGQPVHLPFIATELIACEVEELLDAFTRIIPGQLNGLERLLDFLILGAHSDPTILGYVVRVLLVIINRRVSFVDEHIKSHLEAVQEGLLDHLYDRSVADLLFRLCLDEGTKSFKLDYTKLVSKLNDENAVCIQWFFDSIFGKPLLGNNEQVVENFMKLISDFRDRDGLSVILEKCFFFENPKASMSALNILSVIIQYCYTRPVSTDSGLSEPAAGWETFGTIESATRGISADDDSCVFDDEMNSPTAQPHCTPFTEFGCIVVSKSIESLNEKGLTISTVSNVQNVLAFLRFMSRCSQYQSMASSCQVSTALISEVCTESFRRYPTSSAIHNACRDCILCICDPVELQAIAATIIAFMVEDRDRLNSSMGSHLMRILHYFDCKLSSRTLQQMAGDDADIVVKAIKRWAEIDTRHVDRQDKVPTRVPSPHGGITPIIDLDVGDQWVAMDFGPPPPSLSSGDNTHSPQVRFATISEENDSDGSL